MADVVRKILTRRPKHSATFSELFEIVPATIHLSKDDRAESPSRPGEEKWQQIVRNLAAHQHDGFVHIRAGLRLHQQQRK